MRINKELCIECMACYRNCPIGAIQSGPDGVVIPDDDCVECGACLKVSNCPTGALYEQEEVASLPRAIRKVFSNPTAPHTGTGVFGRGTEEVKTNDVTGRVRHGQVGVALEIGRPGVGARLSEAEKFTTVLVNLGVTFEPKNPLSQIMDLSTGKIRADVANEKVLSAIVEFSIPLRRLDTIAAAIKDIAKTLDSPFSWGVITRTDTSGYSPVLDHLARLSLDPRPCAKVNLGMGRPLAEK
ncbi:MAG: 4Fe-4S binding protein [Bacillota bacterium]|nr:4Fe-4S binding protein [Bacillota bacterium]